MKTLRRLALLLLAALPFAAQAEDLGLANAYNGFVFGNAAWSGGGESEGPMAVGGNFTHNGAHNTDVHGINGPTVGTKTNATLLVGGNMTVQGGQLNWGNGYVGGAFTTTQPYNLNNGSTLTVGGAIVGTVQGGASTQNNGGGLVPGTIFTDQKAYSVKQSNYIAGLATNVTALTAASITDQNQFNLNVSSLASLNNANYSNVKVVRMSAALQQLFPNLVLNLTNQGNNTVVFDVTGSSVDWKWKNNPNGSFSKMLFNFNGASTFKVGQSGADQFNGSVLAPLADVTMDTRIQGNLIANNLNAPQGIELHFGPGKTFDGNAPVPEPASMLALGLGAAAMLKRRRK